MFEKFPSLTRFSHGWTITEKLDGSNGQILVVSNREVPLNLIDKGYSLAHTDGDAGFTVMAGSRNRMLTADKQGDHRGFARFVQERAEEIVEKLGEGRHFGEWVGPGIQRGYGLTEKRFVLFNTHRWKGADLPERVDCVPVLAEGYQNNPNGIAIQAMEELAAEGSRFAPGYLDPEGIVMLHGPSGTLFKKTFDYDEQGKWAENEARRQAATRAVQ